MRSEREFDTEDEALAFMEGLEEGASFFGSHESELIPPRKPRRKPWKVSFEIFENDDDDLETGYGRSPEGW